MGGGGGGAGAGDTLCSFFPVYYQDTPFIVGRKVFLDTSLSLSQCVRARVCMCASTHCTSYGVRVKISVPSARAVNMHIFVRKFLFMCIIKYSII